MSPADWIGAFLNLAGAGVMAAFPRLRWLGGVMILLGVLCLIPALDLGLWPSLELAFCVLVAAFLVWQRVEYRLVRRTGEKPGQSSEDGADERRALIVKLLDDRTELANREQELERQVERHTNEIQELNRMLRESQFNLRRAYLEKDEYKSRLSAREAELAKSLEEREQLRERVEYCERGNLPKIERGKAKGIIKVFTPPGDDFLKDHPADFLDKLNKLDSNLAIRRRKILSGKSWSLLVGVSAIKEVDDQIELTVDMSSDGVTRYLWAHFDKSWASQLCLINEGDTIKIIGKWETIAGEGIGLGDCRLVRTTIPA